MNLIDKLKYLQKAREYIVEAANCIMLVFPFESRIVNNLTLFAFGNDDNSLSAIEKRVQNSLEFLDERR